MLDTIREQLPSLLTDFKQSYVFYNKNPEYDDYRIHFETLKDNLTSFERKVQQFGDSATEETEQLNQKLAHINGQIEKERIKNKVLKRRLHAATNRSNGASEMIDDYTYIYDEKYTRNWALFIGTVGFIISAIV
jgi:hypothetical protein